MEIYKNIGIVKNKNQWHIIADNTSRIMWGLNFLQIPLENVPLKRKNLLIVDSTTVQAYINCFGAELQPKHIVDNPLQSGVTFVVNFDEKLFVDGGGEDTMYLPISDLTPIGWKYVTHKPLFYLPRSLSDLWLRKKIDLESGDVLVPKRISIGAIHFEKKWRFFMGHPENWILDLVSFINSANNSKWPSDKIYGDWRSDLPFVDETKANLFLDSLTGFELTVSEISKLKYALSEDDVFQLEATKTSLSKVTDIRKRKNIEALILAWTKPMLSSVIDFDHTTVVRPGSSEEAPLTGIDSVKVFAPVHWKAYVGNPIKYLPENLQKIWK